LSELYLVATKFGVIDQGRLVAEFTKDDFDRASEDYIVLKTSDREQATNLIQDKLHYQLKDADKDFIFDETQSDLNKFDKIIDELEPGDLRLPVLIKKYIKQNAKVIAFNVDPLFNNAVDGLMYIRIDDLPESTIKPAIEEFQSQLEKGES